MSDFNAVVLPRVDAGTTLGIYYYVFSLSATVLTIGARPFDPMDPPTAGNFVPPADSTLGQYAPVQFDVTDDTGLQFIGVFVKQGTAYDVVHDGVAASPRYGVTITPIAGGYRYLVQPVGGWTAAPTFVVRAIDNGGQLG